MGAFRRWVLQNWPLKLVALGISLLLWNTYTTEPIVEVGYQVPLEFRNIPPDLEISGDVPAQVHVRVRGRSGLLRRLTPADLDISVDLANARAGETLFRLTLDQVAVPYGAAVVRISPSQVRVILAERRAPPPTP